MTLCKRVILNTSYSLSNHIHCEKCAHHTHSTHTHTHIKQYQEEANVYLFNLKFMLICIFFCSFAKELRKSQIKKARGKNVHKKITYTQTHSVWIQWNERIKLREKQHQKNLVPLDIHSHHDIFPLVARCVLLL